MANKVDQATPLMLRIQLDLEDEFTEWETLRATQLLQQAYDSIMGSLVYPDLFNATCRNIQLQIAGRNWENPGMLASAGLGPESVGWTQGAYGVTMNPSEQETITRIRNRNGIRVITSTRGDGLFYS